ncbi:glycosyltransferase family 2 protein [Pseudomonas sp. NY15354]|uniref:glycosyltransferase family 2 protein n=1 Tax=Pseudomonas sp. NY15354 TaxID=3400351 RepID=UPI003A859F28
MPTAAAPPFGTSPDKPNNPCLIAILLCTYNGAEYLREQLDSFIRQTHWNWVAYASDDGSTDGTLEILAEYQRALGERLVILHGPRQGFARNFISLICNPAVRGEYFAFSDQDDIWLQDKLARGVTALRTVSHEVPALYCSRTELVDRSGRHLGFSPLFTKRPGLRNALVQSLAGANTMLINLRARELLRSTPEDAQIVAHDWLTYLIVSSYGGGIVYDPVPTLLYRQHGGNLIGSSTAIKSRLIRLSKTFCGHFSEWNEMNLKVLQQHKACLGLEHRQLLEQFALARRSPLIKRLKLLLQTRVYRQTFSGNVKLLVAALFKQL